MGANRDKEPTRYTPATVAGVLEAMRRRAAAIAVEGFSRAAEHTHPDYTDDARWAEASRARDWLELAAWCDRNVRELRWPTSGRLEEIEVPK